MTCPLLSALRRMTGLLCVLAGLFAGPARGSSGTSGVPPVTPAASNTGTLLAQSTLYPRAIRLKYGSAATNGRIIVSTNGVIFQSVDNGVRFTLLGKVPVAPGSTERCCATLYEVPQKVGSLPAGTLLSSASYFAGTIPAIEIYISTDAGKTWTYSSTPVTGGDAKHGLWEPEFELAKDGALVVFWSDETDPCCSQKLAQARTYDGLKWQDQINTIATAAQADRPGMVTVSKLPDGKSFMSYEVCGPNKCSVFSRVSIDGWNFGTPSSLGTKIVSARGQYLEHAPVNTWSPSFPSINGRLLIVGQVLYEASGAVSPQNGQVIFTNSSADGAGVWSTMTAPVLVPTAYDNYCPNYSSALLPSADGTRLLELASYYNAAGACMTYYNTGPLMFNGKP